MKQNNLKQMLIAAMLLLSVPLWGADGDIFTANTTEGVEMTFKVISESNKTCQVGRGEWSPPAILSTYSGSITIPSTANGYTVIAIGRAAFRSCALTSVSIPNSIVTIESYAFAYSADLEAITFSGPSKVESIGENAFYQCTNLQSIDIPNSVENIGNSVFYQCSNLASVNIGNSVNSIGVDTFGGCPKLKSVSVNCNTISYPWFFNTCIEEVTIGENVRIIGSSAFSGCTNLTSVTIANGVTNIENYAFYECTNLTSINIPNSVTSIGTNAFRGCTNLTSVTLHGGAIGSYAFEWCTNLTEFYNHGKLNNDGSRDLGTFEDNHAFYQSSIGAATLYVTPNALEQAQNSSIWSQFGKIRMFIPDGYPTPTSATLTDGQEFTGYNENVILEDITYTRTFNNTNWQAMYLPFAMNYADWSEDFDIARINDVHQFDDDDDGDIDRTILEVIKLKDGSTTDANTPYVIRAKSTGEKTFTKTNTMLHKAVEKTFDVSSWFTLFNFVGTYKPILASVVASKGYLVLGDGSLHPMDSNSTPLKSYRWYLRVTDRNGNDKQVNAVRLHILDDGEETDIGMLTADNDCGEKVVHDLSGRRIATANLRNGIYIINGKKVYVK